LSEFLQFLEERKTAMLDDLRRFVEQESPSLDKALVDRMGRLVGELFVEKTGGDIRVVPSEVQGDNLIGTFGSGERQILLIGHFDTVWAQGTLETMPFRIDGDRAYGPGTVDMKGGLIQGIYALHALKERRGELPVRVVFLFNSDEEIGSPSSRGLIEEEAKKSDYVLVLEGNHPGLLTTFRKGNGIFRMKVTGKAAHSGIGHQDGISAIEELARHTLDLHALTDYAAGTTLNVGVVRGGTRFNVVAAEAEAEIDLRVADMREAERVIPLILERRSYREGIRLEVTGGLNRPPMQRTEEVGRLFERVRALGAEHLGLELKESGSGGFSDANLTAPFAPTIDGLGSRGDGWHAVDEHLIISAMPVYAALLAHTLEALAHAPAATPASAPDRRNA
jgi:glutamate carboxypeptidase